MKNYFGIIISVRNDHFGVIISFVDCRSDHFFFLPFFFEDVSLAAPTKSVLQCVAVRCRVVQCVAVWCSVLQCVAVSFPRKNAERLKNLSHETESPSETVHGCRILPYLAYIRCASQERTTQCRYFTRSAPGKSIFSHFLPSHEPHSLG